MAEALNPEFMKQLVLMFQAELDEHMQVMTGELLRLESLPPGNDRDDCLNTLFRSAHNIKGAARGVDARDIERIAHGLESLLASVRTMAYGSGARVVDLCLSALDGMKLSVESLDDPDGPAVNISGLLERLEHWQGEQSQTAAPVPPPSRIVTEPPVAAPADGSREPALTRIALHRLETVTALVEELMASRIEMEDQLQELQAQQGLYSPAGRLVKGLRGCGNRIGLMAGKLQDQIRLMRMMPVSTLLLPLARSVRDIAQELGKKVDYEVIGDDLEVDRPVLEGIKDPLVHLLRNAIDHGIEPPDERLAKGKPATGHITVTVKASGSRIQVIVRDDGRGISPGRIVEAALRKRLLTPEEAQGLTPEEAMDLIFRPGFSSHEIITHVSGRGVGLDVVLSVIRKMKGDVLVDSVEGKGAVFTLDLPLTLSVERGLVVRSGGGLYVIPSTAIVRVLELSSADLVEIGGGQAINFQGRAIPVCELALVLELAATAVEDKPDKWLIVVVEKGWQRVAFLVEDILGEREIVIKRLRPPLLAVRNVIGGTLLGSGRILMVLNPADLVLSAVRGGARRTVGLNGHAEKPVPHVLVVDDSITTRSLEKSLLESQGYRVTTATDGSLAWEALQSGAFDLVVTDVEMPVMDGFELVRRIKSDERFSRIPVVMVTSLAGEADRWRGVAVGADAYVVKSRFESEALLKVINHLI